MLLTVIFGFSNLDLVVFHSTGQKKNTVTNKTIVLFAMTSSCGENNVL